MVCTDDTIQWDLLYRQLIAFIVCVTVGGALLYYSATQLERANRVYQRERTQLDASVHDYRAARLQRHMYLGHVDQFTQFVDAGYIGRERRLHWIEVIRDINATLELPVLKYTISPRDISASADTASLRYDWLTVYESRMQLELGLLHAGDLYVFLMALAARANGLFAVRNCDLTLVDGAPYLGSGHANVQALCELSWYTLGIDVAREIAER